MRRNEGKLYLFSGIFFQLFQKIFILGGTLNWPMAPLEKAMFTSI